MDKLVIFGGTGGIGKKLVPFFNDVYNVMALGSKDVNILDFGEVDKFFSENTDTKVIINMCGVSVNSFMHKIPYQDIIKQTNINTGSSFILRACLPYMRANKYGRIILASSILAKKTVMGTAIYSATKSFVETLARVTAAENAIHNITINALRMGYMDAGLTYTIPEGIRENIKKSIPAGEFGDIENLAILVNAIIDAPYINGASIDVSGGLNG